MNEDIESSLLKKYEIVQKIGKGAYGVVWKAIDKKQNQVVALKKIYDAFQNKTDAKRTYREVMYLREMDHENIIRILNIYKAENNKDLYLVFEFMESDLHSVIRANILEETHRKLIIYQILKVLKYIHSAEVIHHDLKPSNILINVGCKVKITDFGLARSFYSKEFDSEPLYTEYVSTRWYRAPEILLGAVTYSSAVDMWSLGCILGEMMIGKAVFPGTSTLNQIEKIIEVLGKPRNEDIESLNSDLAENIINSININKKKSFASFFPNAHEDALDLLQKLLTFKPSARLTAEEALKHKYVREFYSAKEASSYKIRILDEEKEFDLKDYRDEIYSIRGKQKKQEKKKEVKENESALLYGENNKESQVMMLNSYLSKGAHNGNSNNISKESSPHLKVENKIPQSVNYIINAPSDQKFAVNSNSSGTNNLLSQGGVKIKHQKSTSISKYDANLLNKPLISNLVNINSNNNIPYIEEPNNNNPHRKSNFFMKSPVLKIAGFFNKLKKKQKEEN